MMCSPSGLVRRLMLRAVMRVRMMICPKSASAMIRLVAISVLCRCFFDDGFAFLFLDYHLASLLVQVEGGGDVRLLVNHHQHVVFGKAVEVESGKRVGHDAVGQQAVVHINAEVLSGKVGAELDAVFSFVSHFLVGITLQGECQIEEDARDNQYGKEKYGIEYHEVLMRILSFSAHNFDNFLQKYKKKRKMLWL